MKHDGVDTIQVLVPKEAVLTPMLSDVLCGEGGGQEREPVGLERTFQTLVLPSPLLLFMASVFLPATGQGECNYIFRYSRRQPPPAWLCTPEVKVLWHQKMFRMSSSLFQEPLRSRRPRIFMPKDLRDREGESRCVCVWGGDVGVTVLVAGENQWV